MPDAEWWRSELEAARAALLEAVRDLPQEHLVYRPAASDAGEARRPIRDVLWHVADAEREWQRWASAVSAGAPFSGFDEHRRRAQYNRLTHLLQQLEEARAATLALLAGVDALDLERPYPAPSGEGECAFADMLGALARHVPEHAEQVAAIRREAEARGGR